jgi:hypothetical protein
MSVRSRIKRINLGENDNWEAMRDRLESSWIKELEQGYDVPRTPRGVIVTQLPMSNRVHLGAAPEPFGSGHILHVEPRSGHVRTCTFQMSKCKDCMTIIISIAPGKVLYIYTYLYIYIIKLPGGLHMLVSYPVESPSNGHVMTCCIVDNPITTYKTPKV